MTDDLADAVDAVGDAIEAIEQNTRAAWEQGIESRIQAVEGHTHDTEHTHTEFAASEHEHDTAHEHAEYAAAAHEHETHSQIESEGSSDVDTNGAEADARHTVEVEPDRGHEKVPHRSSILFRRVSSRR